MKPMTRTEILPGIANYRPRWLIGYVVLAYGIFLAGFLLFPDYNDQYRYFKWFLFVPGLPMLLVALQDTRHLLLSKLISAYFIYFWIAAIWSADFDWYAYGQKLTTSIMIISFMGITYYLFSRHEKVCFYLISTIIIGSSVYAAYELILYYSNREINVRLYMPGALTNINEFSNVYGVLAIFSCYFAYTCKLRSFKVLFPLACLVVLMFVYFAQSRMAFFSLSLALIVLVMLQAKRIVYVLIPLTLIVLVILAFPQTVESYWNRGLGLRPAIWAELLREIYQNPLFGHGLTAKPVLDIKSHIFETAHNTYLHTLWQGGIVGFGFFIAILGLATYKAWQLGRATGNFLIFALLLFTIGVMFTGVDRLIDRPRDQWHLFWLPLAMLLVELARHGGGLSHTTHPSRPDARSCNRERILSATKEDSSGKES